MSLSSRGSRSLFAFAAPCHSLARLRVICVFCPRPHPLLFASLPTTRAGTPQYFGALCGIFVLLICKDLRLCYCCSCCCCCSLWHGIFTQLQLFVCWQVWQTLIPFYGHFNIHQIASLIRSVLRSLEPLPRRAADVSFG